MDLVYLWKKYTICFACVKETTAVLGDRKNHVTVFWQKKKTDTWLDLVGLWMIYEGLEVTSKGRRENILNFNSGKTEVFCERENQFLKQHSSRCTIFFGNIWWSLEGDNDNECFLSTMLKAPSVKLFFSTINLVTATHLTVIS